MQIDWPKKKRFILKVKKSREITTFDKEKQSW